MNSMEILKTVIKNKDVKFLCKYFFNEDISPLQEKLIRKITFEESKKLSVCAMTRWGKSFCISRGIGLFIMLNSNKKIFFLAPTSEQSLILRDYLAELVYKCPSLKDIAHLDTGGEDKIKKHTSRSRQTFSNGSEYRVFTTHGNADGLMGHGLGFNGGILVLDEACLISEDARAKINRMLGDNPEKSMVVELYNPWTRDNKAFDHSIDNEWEFFHVGWEDAIEDGRITKDFIEEQRKELTPLEFCVLYESRFPEQSEDSIFSLDKINEAIKRFDEVPKSETGTVIIAADIGDKGLDSTVILTGKFVKPSKHDPNPPPPYRILDIYSEPISDNMAVAGRILATLREHYRVDREFQIKIDCIGVGTGVVSRVREYVIENKLKNVEVHGCHYGEKADLQPERFLNKKAMNYFKLKELFEEGKIVIPNHKQLVKELVSMKWKFNSSSKIQIVDPDKSPDYADALVYFIFYTKPKWKAYIN